MIFKCTICDLEFNSLDTLTDHFSTAHQESQITFAGSDVQESNEASSSQGDFLFSVATDNEGNISLLQNG